MNAYANNTSDLVLKTSMVAFLAVQAIRQLVQVNAQADAKTESRSGQVAAWMTITLTLIIAGIMYQSGPLSSKTVTGTTLALFVGIMGSGIAMIYDAMSNKAGPEKNRLWFGIAHVVFAVMLFAFLLYSMSG